jgi:RND family efflux transporter MFP subunit
VEIRSGLRCFARMRTSSGRWLRTLTVLSGIAAMALLLAWLMGAFRTRVVPGEELARRAKVDVAATVVVEAREESQSESAVGTIRAVRETSVAARILGRVKALAIERAGQPVQQGQVIAELFAEDLQAAVEQARASLLASETRRDKARIDLDRTTDLVQKGVAAQDRLDADSAAFRAADAQVEQSKQALAGAESALSFATVKAPIDGIVVDKKVQVGDVVQPGQAICSLYDPTRLQLVAIVREELAGKLQPGQQVDVGIDALGKQCRGTVAEIVPEASAASRSFEVKVTGPCQPGIVTGMFGRLDVPLGVRRTLRVPERAIVRTGQLDFVYAVGADGTATRRYVRLGVATATGVEALSGIVAGERIVADAAAFAGNGGEGRGR